MQSLQFLLLACALPALTALSLPPRWRPARHGSTWMSAALLLELVTVIAWRVPASVDGLAHHRWLSAVEGACLLVAGTTLWSFLVAAASKSGKCSRSGWTPSYPWRMAVAAVVMWSIWILAYLVGFSRSAWYPAYGARPGLSTVADQQIATGVLWAGAGLAFLPVIFWSLWQWLAPERDGLP